MTCWTRRAARFRWLAVFVGGSPLEAALAVLGPATTAELLDSLASKSLVRQSETDGAARLMMLETIREFGWEQLAQTAELEAARRAHATYYLSFAEGRRIGTDRRGSEGLAEAVGPRARQPAGGAALGDGPARQQRGRAPGRRAAPVLVCARTLERGPALVGRRFGPGRSSLRQWPHPRPCACRRPYRGLGEPGE